MFQILYDFHCRKRFRMVEPIIIPITMDAIGVDVKPVLPHLLTSFNNLL